MVDKDTVESIGSMERHPEYEEMSRLVNEADAEYDVDLRGEHAVAFWLADQDGYLQWKTTVDLSLQALYLSDRKLRGLTGVLLYSSQQQVRYWISAFGFGPGPFAQLQETALRVGVDISVARSELGALTGLIDAGRAGWAAQQLTVVRTGSDMFGRRRCRHRRPVGEGVR